MKKSQINDVINKLVLFIFEICGSYNLSPFSMNNICKIPHIKQIIISLQVEETF